jgi:hypothetical protein
MTNSTLISEYYTTGMPDGRSCFDQLGTRHHHRFAPAFLVEPHHDTALHRREVVAVLVAARARDGEGFGLPQCVAPLVRGSCLR